MLSEMQVFENLRVQKNLHIEKISITIVQMKFLAMHITNQNAYIYSRKFTNYLHGPWCMTWLNNDFWHKRKIDNVDAHNVLLVIPTNIPVLLMNGFVVQGHKCWFAAQETQPQLNNYVNVM